MHMRPQSFIFLICKKIMRLERLRRGGHGFFQQVFFRSLLSIATTMNDLYTIYGKTFEWENFFCGWYANDHSRGNFRGCLTPSRHVLHETYRITYSIKIHGKIFAIECKIAKVFQLESFAVYIRVYKYRKL